MTCLGTADALGTGGRHCAGYKLEAEGGLMLLEAGPSLLTTLKADGTDMRAIDGVAVVLAPARLGPAAPACLAASNIN